MEEKQLRELACELRTLNFSLLYIILLIHLFRSTKTVLQAEIIPKEYFWVILQLSKKHLLNMFSKSKGELQFLKSVNSYQVAFMSFY